MDKEILNCSKISVDCVYNDPVDIRCGGPEILGFDFFVKGNETESMIIFIKKALNEANIPLISIGVVEKNIFLRENQVWTKEKIVASIFKESANLIREAERNYKPVFLKEKTIK